MGKWEGVLAGPGAGIQLGRHSHVNKQNAKLKNRILLCCGATGYQGGHAMAAVVWYSDDDGQSWSVSPSVLSEMQECQLVELASGTVMMNMRNAHLNKNCDCRAVSRELGSVDYLWRNLSASGNQRDITARLLVRGEGPLFT
jgi:sialidase-1